jgi:RNA polymerase sigma-70 factor, ECF subfamily
MNEREFAAIAERHRRELQIHCYRMLGSVEDSEDLVQETFLRAWRRRSSYEGRSTFRAWLYKIATNACLDFLKGRPRRVLPYDVAPAAAPDARTLPEPGEQA